MAGAGFRVARFTRGEGSGSCTSASCAAKRGGDAASKGHGKTAGGQVAVGDEEMRGGHGRAHAYRMLVVA